MRHLTGFGPLLLSCVFLCSNIFANLVTAHALSCRGLHLVFPVLLTFVGEVTLCVSVWCMVALQWYRVRTLSLVKMQVAGALAGMGTVFHLSSIATLGLATSQALRAAFPVVTAMVTFVIEGKRYTRVYALVLCATCASVTLCVWDDYTMWNHTTGVLQALASLLFGSVALSLGALALDDGLVPDVLDVLAYQSPASCWVVSAMLLANEGGTFLDEAPYFADWWTTVAWILLVAMLYALGAWSSGALLETFDPTYVGVLGNIQISVTVWLGQWTFEADGRPFRARNWTGFSMLLACMAAATFCVVKGLCFQPLSSQQQRRRSQVAAMLLLPSTPTASQHTCMVEKEHTSVESAHHYQYTNDYDDDHSDSEIDKLTPLFFGQDLF